MTACEASQYLQENKGRRKKEKDEREREREWMGGLAQGQSQSHIR